MMEKLYEDNYYQLIQGELSYRATTMGEKMRVKYTIILCGKQN